MTLCLLEAVWPIGLVLIAWVTGTTGVTRIVLMNSLFTSNNILEIYQLPIFLHEKTDERQQVLVEQQIMRH